MRTTGTNSARDVICNYLMTAIRFFVERINKKNDISCFVSRLALLGILNVISQKIHD